MRALLLAVVLCLPAYPQPRTRTAAPPVAEVPAVRPEERCTIEGSVQNALTGEPLRKANLTLRLAEGRPGGGTGMSYTTSTDAAGRFTIANIEPGKYRLSAERTGFVDQQYGAKTPSQGGAIITLDKSQKLRDAAIRMTPHGVVAGRVLDEDGDPLANTNIQVLRSAYVRGRKQLIQVENGSTNDLGEYRIYGLPPGRYVISAVNRGGGFRGRPVQDSDHETYAPTIPSRGGKRGHGSACRYYARRAVPRARHPVAEDPRRSGAGASNERHREGSAA